MPEIKDLPVKNLKLDLKNFRTVPQESEIKAISAMISISPDYFWGLTKSLLDDGYIPTENIIVLRNSSGRLVVREGNRRVAALKLIHGSVAAGRFDIPDDLLQRIGQVTPEWKQANVGIPCAIYEEKEKDTVDKIVTLIHGKGDKASRENWEAIARARHSRDVNGNPETALDLFEKYLKKSTNITDDQRQRWAGDFSITVLDEAIKKISKRFGANSAPDLASKYPSIKHRSKLDNVMRDIGMKTLGFKQIRADGDFLSAYGVPGGANQSQGQSGSFQGASGTQTTSGGSATSTSSTSTGGAQNKKVAAVSMNDPKAVKRALKSLAPRGHDRQKVVSLKKEALYLNLERNPFAFCFILRSMFEISAKLYCNDHKKAGGPSSTDKNGNQKQLKSLLQDVTNHLTANNSNKAMVKDLHGAQAELARSSGILSVTSMNQLVHSPSFTITASDLSSFFGNVFPLLRAMNE